MASGVATMMGGAFVVLRSWLRVARRSQLRSALRLGAISGGGASGKCRIGRVSRCGSQLEVCSSSLVSCSARWGACTMAMLGEVRADPESSRRTLERASWQTPCMRQVEVGTLDSVGNIYASSVLSALAAASISAAFFELPEPFPICLSLISTVAW